MKAAVVLAIVIFIMTGFTEGYSQDKRRSGDRGTSGGTISGTVVDKAKDIPLDYAKVVLFSNRDNKQVTGIICKDGGKFELTGIRPGSYYADVKYIGYEHKRIDSIIISRSSRKVDLGIIKLEEAVVEMDGVTVESEKPAVEYKIDRKVINVEKHYTAASGNAVDVLENVPSVSVDIEGNVSLRGSSGFDVLIDGRPTVLDPNDALRQIPATTIENIEIITNPSAKFDPDGTTGIINIVLKKQKLEGMSGIINANIGLDEKYGADFLLNYRNEHYNAYIGADYNERMYPGISETINETIFNDITSFTNSDGHSKFIRNGYSLRAGVDLYLSSADLLSIVGRYGGREMSRSNVLDYDEWSSSNPEHTLYESIDKWERGGDFYSINMDYSHKFDNKGHEIATQFNLSRRGGEEESLNSLYNEDNIITYGRRSTEDGPSTRLRYKVDYKLPINTTDRFEAGLQGRTGKSEDITDLYDYSVKSGEYEYLPEYSHSIEYIRNIHSAYSIYSGEAGSFGYQGGLRGEYTDRSVSLIGENEEYIIDRWDLFPTAHLSYKFTETFQIMSSYTRRIDRPRGWYLEPFETWTDAYNVRRGNPDLKPEYIDSYEIATHKYFGRDMISLEAYYRVTHNKIERVQTVYEENVILHTSDNVGKDFALGFELMISLELFKIWNLNIMGDVYQYRVESEIYGRSKNTESTNWSTRVNNTIKLASGTRIQFSLSYRSPTVTSQGRSEGYFSSNAAIRQDFFDNTLSATLQFRDVFATAKREYTSEGLDFYRYNYSERRAPQIMLTLSYLFNNYKVKQDRQERNGDMENDDF